MCLIAYVPAGKSLTREVFDKANSVNPDGIGVMSADGVQHFFGSKQLKRARQYVQSLVDKGISHAVHWRYATHGSKRLEMCHPFKLPNQDVYLMHNGVIGAAATEARQSGKDVSDTFVFVSHLTDAPTTSDDLEYWNKVCGAIGSYNKCVVMYPGGKFVILNKDNGKEVDGIWYSNEYSLPHDMRGKNYYSPSRLQPSWWDNLKSGAIGYSGTDSRGSYWSTGQRASDFGGPFGHSIYWSHQHRCYGFWEGKEFKKLTVGLCTESTTQTTEQQNPQAPVIVGPEERKTETKVTETSGSRMQHSMTKVVTATFNRCPRCNRPKDQTMFAACACTPDTLANWYAAQGLSPALTRYCDHGAFDWTDCQLCIQQMEAVHGAMLPTDHGGHLADDKDEETVPGPLDTEATGSN